MNRWLALPTDNVVRDEHSHGDLSIVSAFEPEKLTFLDCTVKKDIVSTARVTYLLGTTHCRDVICASSHCETYLYAGPLVKYQRAQGFTITERITE